MKKIIAIISGSLVTLLLAVTIVLACTKFTADTIVTYDKLWAMEVYNTYHDSEDPQTLNKNDKEFKEIIRLYKESLQENNLSALFQGAKGFEVKDPVNKEVTIKSIIDNEDGNYVFCLMYDEAQKLVVNGEDFVNPNSKTQEVVTYEKLYVEVKNTANYTEYKVYLADNADTYSTWSMSFIGQQSELFAYIGEIKYQF